MHAEHAALLAAIRRAAGTGSAAHHGNDAYLGSGHAYYSLTVPARRAIARAWLAPRRKADPAEVLAVAESLFAGPSHEEKTLATMLIAGHAAARRAVSPGDVERWLGRLNGWAEVDSLCQNLFPADQLLADWPGWKAMIERLSRAADLNRRRASLVLLVGPVRRSADPRLDALAFAMIEAAKGERDILITKAVSWLLRELTALHRDAVARYVEAHAASLPSVAVRETRRKLATGRK